MYEAKSQKAEMKIQPSETERMIEDYWGTPWGSPNSTQQWGYWVKTPLQFGCSSDTTVVMTVLRLGCDSTTLFCLFTFYHFLVITVTNISSISFSGCALHCWHLYIMFALLNPFHLYLLGYYGSLHYLTWCSSSILNLTLAPSLIIPTLLPFKCVLFNNLFLYLFLQLGFFNRAIYYRIMPKHQGVKICKAERYEFNLRFQPEEPQKKYWITNWTEMQHYYYWGLYFEVCTTYHHTGLTWAKQRTMSLFEPHGLCSAWTNCG